MFVGKRMYPAANADVSSRSVWCVFPADDGGGNNYDFTSAQRERCRRQLTPNASGPLDHRSRHTDQKRDVTLYNGWCARDLPEHKPKRTSATPGGTRPPRRFQHQNVRASEAGPGGGVAARRGAPKGGVWPSCASIRRGLLRSCVCVSFCIGVCVTFFVVFSLHCKAIAPRAKEERCYCSLSQRIFFRVDGRSFSLSFKFDGLSGPFF